MTCFILLSRPGHILLALFAGITLAQSAWGAPALGTPAPSFSLRDLSGKMHTLSDFAYPGTLKARYPKQVVLLDFFRTDCVPCHKFLPQLKALAQKYRSKGLTVLLVALLEDEEGMDKLERFASTAGLSMPLLVDSYQTAANKYIKEGNSVRLPAQVLIDQQGVTRGVFFDGKERQQLVPQIEKLLAP